MRIRINRNNQIVIDRYIQKENDFDPFTDSYNDIFTNFRNYEEQEITLNKDINIFYGNNAQGKTNILEAIYLCAIGKSFQTNQDQELIKIGKEKATVEIEYERKDREGKIKIEIADKKTVYINGIKHIN